MENKTVSGNMDAMSESEAACCVCAAPRQHRRTVLKAAIGAAIGAMLPDAVRAQNADPRNLRPQDGDVFVATDAAARDKPLAAADLAPNAAPIIVYPRDPKTGTVRDGSRLNQVLLLRLDVADLTDAAREHAAQGIVAYSAVCSHAGCSEWSWLAGVKTIKCPCHDSEFDPKDSARVVNGPATRRLARLPVKITDGLLVAAGNFIGRVGFDQT
jgi:rieske iron-sulfur protein